MIILLLLDVTLKFNQSVYSVDENIGSATLLLVINNILSANITLQLKIEEINNINSTCKWLCLICSYVLA